MLQARIPWEVGGVLIIRARTANKFNIFITYLIFFLKVQWSWEGGKYLVLRSVGHGAGDARWHISGSSPYCHSCMKGFPGPSRL
jgi:hypothetical protein